MAAIGTAFWPLTKFTLTITKSRQRPRGMLREQAEEDRENAASHDAETEDGDNEDGDDNDENSQAGEVEDVAATRMKRPQRL